MAHCDLTLASKLSPELYTQQKRLLFSRNFQIDEIDNLSAIHLKCKNTSVMVFQSGSYHSVQMAGIPGPPPPFSYWRWENWWSRSAQGPEPVLSGSTLMTAAFSPPGLALCPHRPKEVGEQVDSVDAAPRPRAADGGRELNPFCTCSFCACDLTPCWETGMTCN